MAERVRKVKFFCNDYMDELEREINSFINEDNTYRELVNVSFDRKPFSTDSYRFAVAVIYEEVEEDG